MQTVVHNRFFQQKTDIFSGFNKFMLSHTKPLLYSGVNKFMLSHTKSLLY
jgi:hypothetical protein